MFSDEKSVGACVEQKIDVGFAVNPAFHHEKPIVGNQLRKPQRCLKVDVERLQIAIVHTDDRSARLESFAEHGANNIRDFFHGAAYGAYERELRLQAAELNDLVLLLCYMEIVGLPNPATLYLLDVYPYLLEQFHLWHRRMGMDKSPLGTLPCC